MSAAKKLQSSPTVPWAELAAEQRAAMIALLYQTPEQVAAGRAELDRELQDGYLAVALDELKPWETHKDVAIAAVLQHWAEDHGVVVDDVLAVAAELESIGRAANIPDRGTIANLVARRLLNLAERGSTSDNGPLFKIEIRDKHGRKARSHRRWKALPDGGRRLLQQDLDVAELMRPGRPGGPRKRGAALAWLRRHPDLHAKDAPPARRAASDSPVGS